MRRVAVLVIPALVCGHDQPTKPGRLVSTLLSVQSQMQKLQRHHPLLLAIAAQEVREDPVDSTPLEESADDSEESSETQADNDLEPNDAIGQRRLNGRLVLDLEGLSRWPTSREPVAALSLDPDASIRLLQHGFSAVVGFSSALGAALRLLAPMIVARRCLNYIGYIAMDWYRGRYLRTTYKQLEGRVHYYQVPAALRSLGRWSVQVSMLGLLGKIMEWMVGLDHLPCSRGEALGCRWWCGLLWIGSVVGTGHAGAAAVAVWGGPLRLQTAMHRPPASKFFRRPWRVLQWLRDPDRWIREIAIVRRDSPVPLKPFQPDPLLFPATWEPLAVFQMIILAIEMRSTGQHAIMRQVLVQQAFRDEWYRVLMYEKRVVLGIAVMVGYLMSSIVLFVTVALHGNHVSTILLLPYLLSVMISGYMNVFFYYDRRQARKQGIPNGRVVLGVAAADLLGPRKFVVKRVQW